MLSAGLLDEKITAYLGFLNTAQKRALLALAETFIEEHEVKSKLKDTSFNEEINKRFAEYEGGKIKPISLDSLEARVTTLYKTKNTSSK